MALTNYRDLSRMGSDTNAGFQFEFSCGSCSRSWKSPFKPYRKGQFAGLLSRFAYFIGDRGATSRTASQVAEMGGNRAKQAALQEALALAEQRYFECPGCDKAVCDDCWNPRTERCEACTKLSANRPEAAAASRGASGAALSCPNCRAAMTGGRFCAECGFDMASTHKSCPGCGAMCARSARYCTDCGHGF